MIQLGSHLDKICSSYDMKNFLRKIITTTEHIAKGFIHFYKILSKTTLFIFTILFTMFLIDIIAVTVFFRVPLFTRLYYSPERPTSHTYKGLGYVIDIAKSEGSNKIAECQECGYIYIIEILGKEVYMKK